MPKKRILTRKFPDPAGNLVDIYPEIKLVRTFVFNDDKEISYSYFFKIIIKCLLDIRKSKNKKVRERDFPVWAGFSVNWLEMKLFSVAIPDPIDIRVFNIFYNVFKNIESYIEVGAYLLRDINGKPVVRYKHGKIIIYKDPFDTSNALSDILPPEEEEFEIRSWEEKKLLCQDSPYVSADSPEYTSPKLHDFSIWAKNRDEILKFVMSLKGACGYNNLKKIITNSFGIGIFEQSEQSFYKYGCIRMGWLNNDLAASVRILINDNLDYKLKYVILAHEISHYCLHFPMLLLGQLVEETSWSVPEIELYYDRALKKYSSEFLENLEYDANQLATFFLLPSYLYPMDRLSNVILEGNSSPSPEELIWRFMQPLFPDTSHKEYSWINWHEMKSRMHREVAELTFNKHNDRTIYISMLDAALKRETQNNLHEKISIALNKVSEDISSVLMKISAMESKEARDYTISLLSSEELRARKFEDSRKLSEIGLQGSTFLRELIPPLEPAEQNQLYPRIPLIPAIYNLEGNIQGDWYYLPQRLDSPAGTVEDWLRHKPGYGLILYRYETWQKKLLKKI